MSNSYCNLQLIWKLPAMNFRGYTPNFKNLWSSDGDVLTQTEGKNFSRTGMRGWKLLRRKGIKSAESWRSPDKIARSCGQRFILWTNRSWEVFATRTKVLEVQKSVPETLKWVKKYLRRTNTAAMQARESVQRAQRWVITRAENSGFSASGEKYCFKWALAFSEEPRTTIYHSAPRAEGKPITKPPRSFSSTKSSSIPHKPFPIHPRSHASGPVLRCLEVRRWAV